ncbi:MAG: hypothetical protein CMM77_09060 [Rhodospirillaceae bacterium]|nr:hypothetical protein [Magnetovibrio sp.]MAY67263.1 hypothetical protein [Rhodospirillaceae bacterium]
MKFLQFAFVLMFCGFAAPTEALAYIDPGSGSAIMSFIVGLLVAIGLAVKTFWYKITSLFSRKPRPDDDHKPNA